MLLQFITDKWKTENEKAKKNIKYKNKRLKLLGTIV